MQSLSYHNAIMPIKKKTVNTRIVVCGRTRISIARYFLNDFFKEEEILGGGGE
jgi:hypothetical protein